MTERIETESQRRSSRSEEWNRYQRNQESPSPGRDRLPSAEKSALGIDSRRIQQALLQRISQSLLGQERPAQPNSSLASRNEAQTLAQLQRALESKPPAQNPALVSPRAQAQASQPSLRSVVAKVYTAKQSGTRAKGMTLSKNLRPSRASQKFSPSSSAATHSSASRSSSGAAKSSRSSASGGARPANSISTGGLNVASSSGSPVSGFSAGKLLSKGISVFFGKSAKPVQAGPAPSATAGSSIISLSRPTTLSPALGAQILALKIPPKLKAFYAGLRPTSLTWALALTRFLSRIKAPFKGRGRSDRKRVAREWLRRMRRRWMRKKSLETLYKRRVRRISYFISRRPGRAKTKDLKGYY